MNTLKIYVFLLGVFSAFTAIAQPPPPPATPIDGGLSILLAGGVFLGAKKLIDTKK